MVGMLTQPAQVISTLKISVGLWLTGSSEPQRIKVVENISRYEQRMVPASRSSADILPGI
jgi:hypothetical protein